ncbi:MAG: hypothetical protein AAF668_13960 [Pseudomonadota bacterium]
MASSKCFVVFPLVLLIAQPSHAVTFDPAETWWSGWSMWPDSIIFDLKQTDPTTLEVINQRRLVLTRGLASQDYTSLGGEYVAERVPGGFDVYESGLLVSTLPDSFWQAGQLQDAFGTVNEIAYTFDHSVDWGRADVIIPCLTAGFFAGMLLDLVSGPTMILLSFFGRSTRNLSRGVFS